MPSFIFYLVVVFEALGLASALSLDTQFVLGCLAALAAFTLDCLKTETPAARQKNNLYVMAFCMFYALHVLTLSYIMYTNQYKQWVAGADIHPLYEQPFDYAVGARLTMQFTEPVTPFYYTSMPQIYRTTDNRGMDPLFGWSGINPPKTALTGREVHMDFYFPPYKRLKDGNLCLRPKADPETAPPFTETERLSVHWYVWSEMTGGETEAIGRQIEGLLSLSGDSLTMMRELPETFRQFFPESLDKKGFATRENSQKQKCYIYPRSGGEK